MSEQSASTLTAEETADWQTARSIVSIARNFADDLPDGMGDEIGEAYEGYKDARSHDADDARRTLIADIKEICADWGFPFA